ncbi:MAG: branched-chain amino acid ABC transporter permease [Actinomycetia bacterium]|nr:branched-chain amino acid ABC transporter permease [Actinomycetes bacterium]
MNYFLAQLVNGITLGGMYALIALGYTMVYGVLLMINFAHSEMFMAGAYIGLGTLLLLSNAGTQNAISKALPFLSFLKNLRGFFTGSTVGLVLLFIIVLAVAALLTGCLGVLIERFAYRPLRHAPRLAPLISALGVSIFLQNAFLLWVGNIKPFPSLISVKDLSGGAGLGITPVRIMIVVTSLVILVILDLFIARTKIGKAMRATSQDQDASGLMGINVNSIIAMTFFIGPALGAVAGVFSGVYYHVVTYNMGFMPGIKSFTAAVIGGIGNLRGAMLGGFLLGLIESFAQGYISASYKDVITFMILIIILIFRPGGLLGSSVVEKV